MKRRRETVSFLHDVGYPDTIFSQWGITLDENNRKTAELEWEKILSSLPTMERSILELRYQKCLTLRQISEELGIPLHFVRKQKEGILRKIMNSKAGINLYQTFR